MYVWQQVPQRKGGYFYEYRSMCQWVAASLLSYAICHYGGKSREIEGMKMGECGKAPARGTSCIISCDEVLSYETNAYIGFGRVSEIRNPAA
jgi:hypothetical protein